MSAGAIAVALKGSRSGQGWVVPCVAHDDSNPSLSLADGEDGKLLVHCFAGCDARDVLAVLRGRGLLDDGTDDGLQQYNPRSVVSKNPPLDWSPRAENIWQAAVPIIGTPAEAYLRGRGCFIPTTSDLRFLAAGKTIYPAMVARITDVVTGQAISLHFTYLLADGSGKAPIERPKVLLKGHRKAGGVIRLTDDAEVTMGLGLAEGIETALACIAEGWHPVWAAIDAGNIASFPVLLGIECLTIFADHDKAGLEAARCCEKKWRLAGREVRIVMPASIGSDWADIIKRKPQ